MAVGANFDLRVPSHSIHVYIIYKNFQHPPLKGRVSKELNFIEWSSIVINKVHSFVYRFVPFCFC